MGFTPFFYGLETLEVYDKGNMFDVKVLDISDDDIANMFGAALKNIAALSLAANYPTLAAVPHSLINGFKNIVAISLGSDYTFPLAEKVKAYLANPGAGGGGGGGDAPAKAAAAPEPEEEEEEEEGGDFDLFD
jgi:large subunit ribosomal protein LP0